MTNHIKSTLIALLMIILSFSINGCSKKDKQLPKELQPRIIVGENFLEKRKFIASEIGVVTDIKELNMNSSSNSLIGISGRDGAMFVDKDGQIKKSIKFLKTKDWNSNFEIIYSKHDNSCYFFGLPAPGAFYYGLLNQDGKEVWKKSDENVRGATYGDINKDGEIEFLISSDNKIDVLNLLGNRLFEIKGYSSNVIGFDDTENNEKTKILIQPGRKLIVLNDAGVQIYSTELPLGGTIYAPSFVRYPNAHGKQHLLFYENTGKFVLISPDGKKRVVEFEGNYLGNIKATAVHFDSEQPPYFAISGLIFYQGEKWFGLEAVITVLYIFNSQHKLVYHEILDGRGEAIAAISSGKVNEEILLVGGSGNVSKYVLKR